MRAPRARLRGGLGAHPWRGFGAVPPLLRVVQWRPLVGGLGDVPQSSPRVQGCPLPGGLGGVPPISPSHPLRGAGGVPQESLASSLSTRWRRQQVQELAAILLAVLVVRRLAGGAEG